MPISLSPYITFTGTCRQAMEFYQGILGGTLLMSTFGESPMQVADEDREKIVHASLENDWLNLLACDAPHDVTVVEGANVQLSLSGSDEERLRQVFDGLSQGGRVEMPLAKQFWGDKFGMVTDQFGIRWMVNISAS